MYDDEHEDVSTSSIPSLGYSLTSGVGSPFASVLSAFRLILLVVRATYLDPFSFELSSSYAPPLISPDQFQSTSNLPIWPISA